MLCFIASLLVHPAAAAMSCAETKHSYQEVECCSHTDNIVPACKAGARSSPHVAVIYHAELADGVNNAQYNAVMDQLNQNTPSTLTDLISSSITVTDPDCEICDLRNIHYSFPTPEKTIMYYGAQASEQATAARTAFLSVLHLKQIEVIGDSAAVAAIQAAMQAVAPVYQKTQADLGQAPLEVVYRQINAERVAFDTRCT